MASLPQANIIFKHVTSTAQTLTHIHGTYPQNVITPQPPPATICPEQEVQRCVIRDNVYLPREIPTVTATFGVGIAWSYDITECSCRCLDAYFQAIFALRDNTKQETGHEG